MAATDPFRSVESLLIQIHFQDTLKPRLKSISWTLVWFVFSSWLSHATAETLISDIVYIGFPLPFRVGSMWVGADFYVMSLIADILIWYGIVSWVLWRRDRVRD